MYVTYWNAASRFLARATSHDTCGYILGSDPLYAATTVVARHLFSALRFKFTCGYTRVKDRIPVNIRAAGKRLGTLAALHGIGERTRGNGRTNAKIPTAKRHLPDGRR
jgi:hypothetical protein